MTDPGSTSTPRAFPDAARAIAVFGAGLVGCRAARSLVQAGCTNVVLVARSRPVSHIAGVTSVTGWPHAAAEQASVVIVATEARHQFGIANELVGRGVHVITTADDPRDVERLWTLDDRARAASASLGIGATYSPGVSSLLVAQMMRSFDDVSDIRTAQFGTGGPACARQHHRAMSAWGREVHAGRLRIARAGTGRELVWFPEPVGAADCFRAGLADPFVLHQAFPDVERIESRQAATRRDRLTARWPMLRPPHAEGLVGAVWAEVRGRIDGRVEHRQMAASAPQATGAAALAAAMACEVVKNTVATGSEIEGVGNGVASRARANTAGIAVGVWSAASAPNPVSLLQSVSKDVRLWTYDGAGAVTTSGARPPIQAARKWAGHLE